MDEPTAGTDERSTGLDRLVFFSDAVFAIVITLLVLPLAAEAELPEGDGLAGQVWALWPNLVLLAVSFMPFPTALLGASSTPSDHFPVVFYAAGMTLASASLTAAWLYVLRAGLVDQHLDPRVARLFTTRSLVTLAVFVASIGAAFLGLRAAILFWLALLPAARVLLARRHLRSTPAPTGGPSDTRSR
jgi:uncharacterized membrane protein